MELPATLRARLGCAVFVEVVAEPGFDIKRSPHMAELASIGVAPEVLARQRSPPFTDHLRLYKDNMKAMYAEATSRPPCGPDLADWTKVTQRHDLCYDILLIWYCEAQTWHCTGISLRSQDYGEAARHCYLGSCQPHHVPAELKAAF